MTDYDEATRLLGGDVAFDEGGVEAAAGASATSGVVSGSVAVDAPADAPAALSSAVDATVAELLSELRRHAGIARAEGRGFVDMVAGFCAAVAWRREPWLWALGGAHLLAALVAIRHRRSSVVLSVLFAGGCAAVLLGERLNALAAAHWRHFATQDYFDGRGVFYSAVVGGPVLLNLLLVVALYLLQCTALLVEAKAGQIRAARRQAAVVAAGGKAKKGAAATPARRRAAAPAAAAAAEEQTPRRRTRSQNDA